MSRHSNKASRARRAPAPVVRSRGRRTGLLALTGVAALAIAGTAAWMTLGDSPMSTTANPATASSAGRIATSTSPAPAQVQSPASTPAQPGSLPAAATALAAASHAAVLPVAAASTAAVPTPSAGTSAPGAAGQQAFVDPKTGKLRPAEHDEVSALAAQPAGARRLARTAQAEPQEFATEGGAMGIAVPDEVQPYTIATKTPDGRLVLEHVTGGKAAAAKVRANTKQGVSPVSKAGKGEPNDR